MTADHSFAWNHHHRRASAPLPRPRGAAAATLDAVEIHATAETASDPEMLVDDRQTCRRRSRLTTDDDDDRPSTRRWAAEVAKSGGVGTLKRVVEEILKTVFLEILKPDVEEIWKLVGAAREMIVEEEEVKVLARGGAERHP